MQFVASDALQRHGAGERVNEGILETEQLVEESIYVVELPLLEVGKSLSAAQELKLRIDPEKQPIKDGHFSWCGDEDGSERKTLGDYCRGWLIDIFPPLSWFPELSKAVAKSDTVAGLTVGVMAIPQSMSYASIANLPLEYGLYAASFSALVYGFVGGSGQLAVGPVALVSLLVEEGLRTALTKDECPEYFDDEENRRFLATETLATECPDEYARLVHICMFVVGIILITASLFRLGFLINFLGHPVISGFTSAAAIIIGLSQVKSWMSVSVPKSQYTHSTVGDLLGKLFRGEARGIPFVFGLLSWAALWGVRKAAIKYPRRCGFLKPLGPLIVCGCALVLIIITGDELRDYGVEVVGLIPRGLPKPTIGLVLHRLSDDIMRVLPTALSVSLIGFMESYAIASTLAAKHGQTLSSTRELRAVGLANLIGSAFAGYPVAGSFSRSAVSNATGALTQFGTIVTGIVLMLTLLIMPSFVRKLPRFVLASVVIASVVNLIAIDEAKRLWKVRRPDFFLWVLAFLGTLFLGVLNGLAIAVIVSILLVIAESVRPQITVLWKLPGTAIYRNVQQGETNGQFVDGVLVIRIGASMYFANVSYIKETLLALAKKFDKAVCIHQFSNGQTTNACKMAPSQHESLGAVRYVVIEMTPVMTLDSTAIHMLEDLVKDFRRRGVQVCFASCTQRVEDTLRKADIFHHLGYEWFHSHVNSAVEFCVRHRAAADTLAERAALLGPGSQDTAKFGLLTSFPTMTNEAKRQDDDISAENDQEIVDLEIAQQQQQSGIEMSNARRGSQTVFRRKSGSGQKQGNTTQTPSTSSNGDPRVLLLASKHRVIERTQNIDPSENESLAPERRALESWAKRTDSTKNLAQILGTTADSPTISTNSLVDHQDIGDKYAFLASRRAVIEHCASGSSSAADIKGPDHETLAPTTVVSVEDSDAPDLMINVIVDCLDRPGLLRDITAILTQSLFLQVRFSEAAVVANRSISVWRCEVPQRGLEQTQRTAALAESRIRRGLGLTANSPSESNSFVHS
mmetsp:Transcript_12210/g.16498  ORF Transcript_12210/g.16498 Transcript_12210/m.16498 type:complete len:1028 (+) Transcript_12210:22-3105(+)